MSDHYNRYRRDEHHYQSHHGHGHYLMYFEFAKKIFRNKTLLIISLAFLLFLLVIGIWLISLLLPLLGQFISAVDSAVDKNGIKGAIETISPYLLKLWEGAGK